MKRGHYSVMTKSSVSVIIDGLILGGEHNKRCSVISAFHLECLGVEHDALLGGV